MNRSQIFRKVIEKATANGYDVMDMLVNNILSNIDLPPIEGRSFIKNAEAQIFFDHDFAKAFWGGADENWNNGKDTCVNGHTVRSDKYKYCYEGCEITLTYWQYHLQQLAIAEDRLKYLEQFL